LHLACQPLGLQIMKHEASFKDKVWQEMLGWQGGDFIHGVWIAVKMLVLPMLHGRGWPTRIEAVASASQKVSHFAVIFSVVSFLVLATCWIVLVVALQIFMVIFDLFGWGWPLRACREAMTWWRVMRVLLFMVSQSVSLFLMSWAYSDQDRVFVATLRHKAAQQPTPGGSSLDALAEALETLPTQSTVQWFIEEGVKVIKGLFLALAFLVLSSSSGSVPFLLLPALMAFRKCKAVGVVPGSVLLLISCLPQALLPSGRVVATCGFQLLLAARSVSAALLDSMLRRCTKAQRQRLSTRHRARITGFGIMASLLLSIPVLGPLLWFDLVKLAAEVLGSIVLAEDEETFDLRPVLKDFWKLQAAKTIEQRQQSCQGSLKRRTAKAGEDEGTVDSTMQEGT